MPSPLLRDFRDLGKARTVLKRELLCHMPRANEPCPVLPKLARRGTRTVRLPSTVYIRVLCNICLDFMASFFQSRFYPNLLQRQMSKKDDEMVICEF